MGFFAGIRGVKKIPGVDNQFLRYVPYIEDIEMNVEIYKRFNGFPSFSEIFDVLDLSLKDVNVNYYEELSSVTGETYDTYRAIYEHKIREMNLALKEIKEKCLSDIYEEKEYLFEVNTLLSSLFSGFVKKEAIYREEIISFDDLLKLASFCQANDEFLETFGSCYFDPIVAALEKDKDNHFFLLCIG